MHRFRIAGPEDVDAIVSLVTSAYRGEASRVGWTTEADWLDGQRTSAGAVRAVIDDPRSVILLVEEAEGSAASSGPSGGATDARPEHRGGQPRPARPGGQRVLVASCQLTRRSGRVAYFAMFAVRPERQGHGTGRALLAEAERMAAEEWGATEMRMSVIAVRSELIAWYERRGYHADGETEPFPYDEPAFGVPRVPGLYFSVLTKALVGP